MYYNASTRTASVVPPVLCRVILLAHLLGTTLRTAAPSFEKPWKLCKILYAVAPKYSKYTVLSRLYRAIVLCTQKK